MHIYIEYQARNYPQTQKILKKFQNAEIVWIKNYKNIFDKNLPNNFSLKPSFVVAKLIWNSILKAPDGYGHNNKNAYFLRSSLNCIFDCDYCYLKWAFKNDIPVYFVNYNDIKNEIKKCIKNNIITDNKSVESNFLSKKSIKTANNSNQITDDNPPKADVAEGNNSLWLKSDNLWLCSNNQNLIFWESEEQELIKLLSQYKEILEETAEKYYPHILANYIYEVTKAFNNFYNNLPVLNEENPQKRKSRLALVDKTIKIIKDWFEILWINLPEKM